MAIEVDGKIYRNLPEQVEENANQIEDIKTWLSELGTVMVYKGSVATYADLPTENQKIGDFYNVLDTGDNYAWDGEGWDQVASSVDLSNLVDLDGAQTITGVKTFTAQIISALGGSTIWNYDKGIKFGNTAYIIGNSYDELGIRSGSAIYFRINNDTKMSINSTAVEPRATTDLGSSTNKWQNLYVSDSIYLTSNWKLHESSNGIIYLENVGQNTGLKFERDKLFSEANNYTSLGTSAKTFKDLYLGGTIDFGDGATIIKDSSNRICLNYSNATRVKIASSETTFINRLGADSDNTYDIGRNTVRWKDLYLAGNLSDGTNSVSVAQLAWQELDLTGASITETVITSPLYNYEIALDASATIPNGIREISVVLDNDISIFCGARISTVVKTIAFITYGAIVGYNIGRFRVFVR